MPRVAFLIPASPVPAFFAQIAAFSLALQKLPWHRWEPSVHTCMGGDIDTGALRGWLPHLKEVATVLVPAAESARMPSYYAQIDGLYRWAPRDADILVRMDADTLPVGDIEDLLDYVAHTGVIAGVIAHYPFPPPPGATSREAWCRAARGLISAPLDFAYTYSLMGSDSAEDNRVTPFYLNDGAVFFARTIFDRFAERYCALRAGVMDRLADPYYSGQVALALAAAEIGAGTCALPMRYNFPNDEQAAERFPEELEGVKIFHYLRTEAFDRHRIFTGASDYRHFLETPLTGANQVFQRHVRRMLGDEYPFNCNARDSLIVAPPARRVDALVDLDTAASAPALAPDFAAQFEASGGAALEALMRFKRSVVARLGVDRGFAVYRERLTLPDSDHVRLMPLESQHSFAKTRGEIFVETAPAGEPFTIEPPVVIGKGARRPLQHVARSQYVACLRNARVRGRSTVIQAGGVALLDYQDNERELFDWEFDIEPAIFHAANREAWLIEPRDSAASMQVDEAFMLLGPQSAAFGDWMIDYLPRYVAANMSGALPSVPLLIDTPFPEVHRQSLEPMLPSGAELVQVPAYTTIEVRRLWCAPTVHYAPTRERMDGLFKFDYVAPPPQRIAPVTREIARRVALVASAPNGGSERVYLARRPSRWRKLVNHVEIEAAAAARGFTIVTPEDLDFFGQVSLIRGARFIVGPEGSSLYLAYFALPGTKLCILNHILLEWATTYGSYLSGAHLDISIVTGPLVQAHPDFPHRADYKIDVRRFTEFLDGWLAN